MMWSEVDIGQYTALHLNFKHAQSLERPVPCLWKLFSSGLDLALKIEEIKESTVENHRRDNTYRQPITCALSKSHATWPRYASYPRAFGLCYGLTSDYPSRMIT
jgi:hypothetical protein